MAKPIEYENVAGGERFPDGVKKPEAPTLLPIPMLIWCPMCSARHIDVGEFATKHHHTHSCQKCGLTWRPAIVPTVGVAFLPGFKDVEEP